MKNIILIAASALLIFSACKKVDELTKFDINYSTSITVPATSVVNTPYDFYSPDIPSDYEAKFQEYKTSADNVESVTLKSLSVSITSPSGSSLNFMKSIEIYMEADGKGESRIAWKMDIPETVGESMSIDISDVNLKTYITSENFKLRARAINDDVIAVDHVIKIDGTFEVDGKVL